MDPHNPSDANDTQDMHPRRQKTMWIVLALVAVLVVGVTLWKIVGQTDNGADRNNKTPSAAATQLYSALANAAGQKKLHVGMYRETYANKADATARRNPGSIASSVSELDTTNANYRSVFANTYLHHPGFDVGRCLDGTTYNQDYEQVNKAPRATSLQDIASHLKLIPEGHLYKVTQALTFVSCPHLGLFPGSSPDLAMARLSDGVFPVTVSEAQASAWKSKVVAADLFEVKDEGTVEKDGKTLRKISFSPKSDSGVNKRLYDIFYETAEIEKVKAEHPDTGWEHGFISINPLNTGSVGGYYLIDEKTHLPIYSELYGTNADKPTNSSPSAGRNLARTKQNYSYPSQLTIDLNTPLEFLK